MLERIDQLVQRLRGYNPVQVVVELLVIWFVVYALVKFVESARASRTLKLLFCAFVIATLVIRILGARESFQRLSFLYDSVLPVSIIALLVIFQPELRRTVLRTGEFSLFRRRVAPETAAVEEIVQAARYLSRAKFGALIVIERQNPLKSFIDGGTPVHGLITAPLLQTIFFPGSALHDLAVVLKGRYIVAAGVQLPLAEPEEMEDQQLGSRHRAAVGISQETDAVVVVVSEETGTISLAERGKLSRGLNEDELRSLLILKYNRGLVTRMTAGDGSAAPGASQGQGEGEGGRAGARRRGAASAEREPLTSLDDSVLQGHRSPDDSLADENAFVATPPLNSARLRDGAQ